MTNSFFGMSRAELSFFLYEAVHQHTLQTITPFTAATPQPWFPQGNAAAPVELELFFLSISFAVRSRPDSRLENINQCIQAHP